MKPRNKVEAFHEHEEVYHAASRYQAAALSLTARRLHGQKKPCSKNGQKRGSLASQKATLLGDTAVVKVLRCLKGGRDIGLVRAQQCPDVDVAWNSARFETGSARCHPALAS